MDGGSKVTNEHEEKGEEVESKSQKEDHVSEVKERNSMESKFQELWIEFSKDKTALTKVRYAMLANESNTAFIVHDNENYTSPSPSPNHYLIFLFPRNSLHKFQ